MANDGAVLCGSGSTSVSTAQDLAMYSGIPPLVRSGDWFAASFTLRNGSDKPMKVTAKVDLQPHLATGRPLTVTIPAGGAAPVAWNLRSEEHTSELQSLMRISYAVFCLQKKTNTLIQKNNHTSINTSTNV